MAQRWWKTAHLVVNFYAACKYMHPWTLTWNIIMEVLFRSFSFLNGWSESSRVFFWLEPSQPISILKRTTYKRCCGALLTVIQSARSFERFESLGTVFARSFLHSVCLDYILILQCNLYIYIYVIHIYINIYIFICNYPYFFLFTCCIYMNTSDFVQDGFCSWQLIVKMGQGAAWLNTGLHSQRCGLQ